METVDLTNPLRGMKDGVKAMILGLEKMRGLTRGASTLVAISGSEDEDPLEKIKKFLSVFHENSELRDETIEHLSNAICRLQEARAHIMLANQSLAKLIASTAPPADTKTTS